MAITTDRESSAATLERETAEPFRLRVPQIEISLTAPQTSNTVTPMQATVAAPSAPGSAPVEALNPAPTAAQPFRLSASIRTYKSEARSAKSRSARPQRKWQSRLWLAAMSLTCLSGVALVFGLLQGTDTGDAEIDITSAHEPLEMQPRQTAQAPAVVNAHLHSDEEPAAVRAIHPARFEASENSTAVGQAPRGAWLEGTIVLEDGTPAHSSKPHGAH